MENENQNFSGQNSGNNFNNPAPQNFGNNFGQQQNLPNAVGVLVLGIVSCVVWLCYGIPGIICAIISLALSRKANELYLQNPGYYNSSSFGFIKAGKICAIIGLVLGVLYFLLVVALLVFGAAGYNRFGNY